MDNRRIFGIIISIAFLVIFGWAIVDMLEKNCTTQNKCVLLKGLAVGTVFGTILLIETVVAREKAQGTWKRKQAESTRKNNLTGSQIWSRSVIRIILASVLLGLPIIFQGAFVITFAGGMIGLSLEIIYRAITNQMIPIEQSGEVN